MASDLATPSDDQRCIIKFLTKQAETLPCHVQLSMIGTKVFWKPQRNPEPTTCSRSANNVYIRRTEDLILGKVKKVKLSLRLTN
jgi:hypothetical protein